jgi:hypothetical protein
LVAAIDETRTADPWERRWGWGGVASVALIVLWLIIVLSIDAAAFDSTDEEIRSFFDPDDGDSGWVLVASIFLGLAAITLLGFAGSLRTILRRAEGAPGRLAAVAFAGGALAAGLLLLVNAITLGVAAAVSFEDIEVDPAAYRLVDAIVFGLLLQIGVAAAVLIGATSIVALRTGVFPRWLGWAGVIVAVLAFFTAFLFGIPLLLVLLWVLVVSYYILARAPAPASTRT